MSKRKTGAQRADATDSTPTPSPPAGDTSGAPTPGAEAPPPPLPEASVAPAPTPDPTPPPAPAPVPDPPATATATVVEGDGRRFYVLPGKAITSRRGVIDGNSPEHNHEITPRDLGADPNDPEGVAVKVKQLHNLVERGYLEYSRESSADAAIEAAGLQAGRTARRRSAKSTAARAAKARRVSGVADGDTGGGDPRQVG